MNPSMEATTVFAAIGTIGSLVATGIAVLSYGRAMAGKLPSAEMIMESGDPLEHRYKIRIDNPTRRSIYLHQVEFLEPDRDAVDIWPEGESVHGTTARVVDDLETAQTAPPPFRRKSAYLCIPPNASRDLELHVKTDKYDAIRLRLHWSRNLPFTDRFFMRSKIVVDSEQLKTIRRAAETRPAPAAQA